MKVKMDKTTLAIFSAGLLAMSFTFGHMTGRTSVEQKYTKQILELTNKNMQLNNELESSLHDVHIRTVYKTKYLKEYIHAKESSDIDANINDYWVHVINASASLSESTESIIESAETTRVSKIASVVVDNYQDCLYDKQRLVAWQNWYSGLTR